jgi:hypothetical protein
MNHTPFKKPINIDVLIYLVLLVAVILFRVLVLVRFGFKYTDSDQTIMWLGLKEYANGIFHEPRFYGQAYSSMIEALIAVPLYKLGMPASKALPLITSIFALAPFIVISFFTLLKKSPKMALVIISIPLLLPVEYSLLTTIPRGFVAGIFVATFGCISLFYPKSKWGFFLLSFTGVIGFSLNFNAVLLFLPCFTYLFLENVKNKAFYLYTLIGFALGFGLHFLINYFYVLNPYNDVHKIVLHFSFNDIWLSIKKIDPFLNTMTPVFWKTGFLVLLAFVVISIWLFRKKEYNKALAVICIPAFIIFTLGINKVHDGTPSIFYSYARMYLAIPVLFAVSLSFLKPSNSKLFYIYLLLPFVYLTYQVSQLNSVIEESLLPSNDDKVAVATVDKFTDECNHLQDICTAHKIDLVIIVNHPYCDFYDYGCTAVMPDFPKTIRPSYERRTWRFMEDENTVYKNILFVDIGRNASSNPGVLEMLPNETGIFVLKNNTKRTIDLFDQLPVPYRQYK